MHCLEVGISISVCISSGFLFMPSNQSLSPFSLVCSQDKVSKCLAYVQITVALLTCMIKIECTFFLIVILFNKRAMFNNYVLRGSFHQKSWVTVDGVVYTTHKNIQSYRRLTLSEAHTTLNYFEKFRTKKKKKKSR